MILRLAAVISIFLAISCSSQDAVESNAPQSIINTGDCFDLKMEQWYISFHKYQEQGMDMYEADQRAIDDAQKGFESCQQAYGKRIASDQ